MAGLSAGKQILGIAIEVDASGMIIGASLAERALGGIETKAKQTRQTVRNASADIGKALQEAAALGIAGALFKGLGSSIKRNFFDVVIGEARTFETAMADLQFAVKGTEKEMAKLRDFSMDVGLRTQFSPQEAVEGLAGLKKAGLSTKDAIAALEPTLDLVTAAGGKLNWDDAIKGSAALLLKFQHTGMSARELIDGFANSTRNSNIQWEDYLNIVDSIGVVPQQLKMTSAEMLTLVGVMKTFGMGARDSGQALYGFGRNLFLNQKALDRYMIKNKLTKVSFENLSAAMIEGGRNFQKVKALKALKFEIFDDASGKMKSTTEIIRNLLTNMEKLSGDSERDYLMSVGAAFTDQAKKLLISLKEIGLETENGVVKGVAAFNYMLSKMKDSAGAVREAAAAQEKTLAGLERFIEGTKQAISIAFGDHAAKLLVPLLQGFRDVLSVFYKLVYKNPAVAKAFSVLAAAIMVAATAIGFVLLGMAGIVTWTHIVKPTLVGLGWTAGVAGQGMTFLRNSMLYARYAGRMLMKTMLPMILLFALWNKIWDKDAKGVWKEMQDGLTQLKVYFEAVAIGFWDGMQRMIKVLSLLGEAAGKAIGIVVDFWREVKGGDKVVKTADENLKDLAYGLRVVGRIIGMLTTIHLVKYTLGILRASLVTIFFNKTVLLGLIAVLEKAVLGIVFLATALWGVLSPALAGSIAMMVGLGFSAATAIAVIAGLALVILALAAYTVYAWDDIKQAYSDIPALLSIAAADIGTFFSNLAAQFVAWASGVKTFWFDLGGSIIDGIKAGISGKWDSFKAFFIEKINWLKENIPGFNAIFGAATPSGSAGGSPPVGSPGALGLNLTKSKLFSNIHFPGLGPAAADSPGTATDKDVTISAKTVTPIVAAGANTDNRSASRKTSINIDKIQFNIAKASEEEAEKLSKMFLEKIQSQMDSERELVFE